jgi:hypothetical protein
MANVTGEDMEELELSVMASGYIKCYRNFGKYFWHFHKNIKLHLLGDTP